MKSNSSIRRYLPLRPIFTIILASLVQDAWGNNGGADAGDGDDASASVKAASNNSSENSSSISFNYYHICDPAIAAIIAWLVLVNTLEVNDFRHRLKAANIQRNNPHRHIASFVAIRLGLRDALFDAAILYSMGYAIVAGFTWGDADPNSLLVIWGISSMVSAAILAVAGFKIPQWLGFYRKSRHLQFLKDTSNRATQAVHDIAEEGSLLTMFRYQSRLGVGKHTTQFVFFMLPFYVDLKIWSFFISITVGLVFGFLYLFIVSKCRQRFKKNRGRVAIGACITLSIVSALIFIQGMYVIDSVWNWDIAQKNWVLFLMSFFGWLALCLIIQGVHYYEQEYIFKLSEGDETEGELEDDAQLFIEDTTLANDAVHVNNESTPEIESGVSADVSENYCPKKQQSKNTERVSLEGQDIKEGTDVPESGKPMAVSFSPENPRDALNKDAVDDESRPSYYPSGYFDRVTLLDSRSKKEPDQLKDSMNHEHKDCIDVDSTPRQIYSEFAKLEQSGQDTKWYQHVWHFLPFKASWDIFVYSLRNNWGCCFKESEFHNRSGCGKAWLVAVGSLKLCINLLAIYVALVACGATYQIRVTKVKLPDVRKILYEKQDEGPVCAFDKKCGDLREFSNKDEAHLARYDVAHCGACAFCSTWNDLELQYSTRKNLASKAQQCGIKTLGGSTEDLQKCLETDIGWTEDCARCWAEDMVCTKQFCIFIYLQSLMTNQLGNFAVSPDTITTATCEEANCEAGNPGHFVRCSGSGRRRMNIVSDIARPPEEQCQVVDVDDWGIFFDPKC